MEKRVRIGGGLDRELGREFAMALNRSGNRGERFREGKPDRGDDHGFEERRFPLEASGKGWRSLLFQQFGTGAVFIFADDRLVRSHARDRTGQWLRGSGNETQRRRIVGAGGDQKFSKRRARGGDTAASLRLPGPGTRVCAVRHVAATVTR